MRRFRKLLAGAVMLLGLSGAGIPPAIAPGGIVNAASRLPASLRGGAIAAGARFTIPGVRLGPEIAVHGSESDPPTVLSDVTVQIAQGDRVVNAGLLLVSAARIDAWMPDAAPLGKVELTVIYQGQSSEPYPLTLVAASAGFYSAQRTPDAARGGAITLRGTGIPAKGLELMVGGKPAEDVRIAAMDCCRGVQQVTFRVPSGSPAGCFVPVQARTADGRPSNAVPISVQAPGEPCRDELDWFREGVEHATRAGFVLLTRVAIDVAPVRQVSPNLGSHFQFDYGVANFSRQESGQRQFPPLPSQGTCTVFTARLNLRQLVGQSRTPAEWTAIPEPIPGSRRLDAGPAISISGPSGPAQELPRDPRQHDYDALLGGRAPFARYPPKPAFLTPGSYTVSAPGGSDVGPFSVKVDVPAPLVWKNLDRLETIDRDAGATVEWKAARSQDAVMILAVNGDRETGDSAAALCLAPASDGHFRIPPIALGNLPAGRTYDDLAASYLLLAEVPVTPPSRIAAQGLDAAFAGFVSVSARFVRYR
jgi:uncharacterized protein (TIGR03437 family)